MVVPLSETNSSNVVEKQEKLSEIGANRSAFVRTKKYGFYHSVSPSTQKLAKSAQKALQRNRRMVGQPSEKKWSESQALAIQATKKKWSESQLDDDRDVTNVKDREVDTRKGDSQDFLSRSFSRSDSGSFCYASSHSSPSISAASSYSYESDVEETLSTEPTDIRGGGKITTEAFRKYFQEEIVQDDGGNNNSAVDKAAKHHLSDLGAMPVVVSQQLLSPAGETVQINDEAHPDDDMEQADHTLSDQQKYPESILRLMKPPPKPLLDLLIVIRNESTGNRRRNACGALKTLASSKPYRVRMAWTKGVIISLAHVLNDECASNEEIDRTLDTLLYLCLPAQNWTIIYQSPGLIDGVLMSIREGTPKIKNSACLCLEQLAKQKNNRRSMSQSSDVLETLTRTYEESKAEDDIDDISDARAFMKQLNQSMSNGSDVPIDNDVAQRISRSTALSVLTIFLGLSNVKDIAFILARRKRLMSAMVKKSGKMDASANKACCMTLANLTRHPHNSLQLVYHVKGFVGALVDAASSIDGDCRKFACCALQNLSCDGRCRQELGSTPEVLGTLSKCCRYDGQSIEERIAALTALKNLSKEASNLVNFTITDDCIRTLVNLVSERGARSIQLLACDTLATLSHWLKRSMMAGVERDMTSAKKMAFPSRRNIVWEQWQ